MHLQKRTEATGNGVFLMAGCENKFAFIFIVLFHLKTKTGQHARPGRGWLRPATRLWSIARPMG
jgi:hypothetical protein